MTALFTLTGIQRGFFRHKGTEYRFEFQRSPSRQRYEFFAADEVICCVYQQHNTIAGLVKADGSSEEYAGDYTIYSTFNDLLQYYRGLKPHKSDKTLIPYDGRFIEHWETSGEGYQLTYNRFEGVIFDEELVVDGGSTHIKYHTEFTKVLPQRPKALHFRTLERSSDEDRIARNIVPIDIIRKKKDITWQLKRHYQIFPDLDTFRLWVKEELDPCTEIVGFDVETTGLSINRFPESHPRRDKLVGIVLSTKVGSAVYIPVRHKRFPNLDLQVVIETLRPYMCLDYYDNSKLKNFVAHNGIFDHKTMKTFGFNVNIVHDTLLLQYMLDPTLGKNKDLKSMCKRYLGFEMIELDDFFKNKKEIRFDLLPHEAVIAYAPCDADITKELLEILYPKLPQLQYAIYGYEVKLISKVSSMEYYGFKVDVPVVKQLKKECEATAEQLKEEIYALAGGQFDIGSGNQLREILFNKMGYKPIKYTKSGQPSTDEQTLVYLSKLRDDAGNPVCPLAAKLLEHRKALSLVSKFFDKILVDEIDGFIFPKYNQTGTDTGRFSSSNPNIQQTSRGIRKLFIPEEDHYFIIVDYSQVEYRILAGMAQEYDLIEAMQDPDTDVHALTASMMFGIPIDFVDKDTRKKGKEINFGSVYGMGIASLAIRLYGKLTAETQKQAAELYHLYFQKLPNITRYFNLSIEQAKRDNACFTWFKRRRLLEHINSPDSFYRSFDERRTKNTPIQGTAADIIKIAQNRLEDSIATHPVLKGKVRSAANVHDEIVLQVHKSINPWQVIAVARDVMELKIEKFPPLYIGVTVGNTWADGKDDGLEIPVQVSDRFIAEVAAGLHTDPVADPRAECQRVIQEYERDKIISVAHAEKLHTKDEMLANNKIAGIVDKFFYKKQEVLDFILRNESFAVEIDDSYDSERDSDARERFIYANDEDDENTVREEESALVGDEAPALVSGTGAEVTALRQSSTKAFTVGIFGGHVIIRPDVFTREMIHELNDYLSANTVEFGCPVYFMKDGEFIRTKYNLYKPNRMDLLQIVEKHQIAWLRSHPTA